jgi:uncharacterized protein with HEPN domain
MKKDEMVYLRHLPADFRSRYPQVPWQDIAGTRDKLIHDYFCC